MRARGLMRPRRVGAAQGALAGLIGLWLVLAGTVSVTEAADPATFGTPTATSTYGQSMEFRQPATITGSVQRAEILITFPGAPGPQVTEIDKPSSGATTLQFRMPTKSGDLLPNTRLSARWRVTGEDGSIALGPSVSVRYADTRFDWKTRTGQLMTVHWYQGGDAFGDRALAIGEKAIRETSQLLGVSEKDPVDFFVYADQNAFYDALGPGTRENVGGEAVAEIRTLFALITPGEIDDSWVGIVIPHELTHLVFNTAVDNPYHFPPRWLNEGLAVYLSQGYDSDDRRSVEDAARNGSLIPLDGISGQFPTTYDRFTLAYAESVSSVDYLVRTYGRDALVKLIRSYANGPTDDEAFSAALGVKVEAFDAAWRKQLNAKDPVAYGPREAAPGPLPQGWSGEAPAPRSSGSNPAATAAPTASSPSPDDAGSALPMAGLVVIVGALVLLGLFVLRQRRRRPAS